MLSIPAQDFKELNINLKSSEIIFQDTVYIRSQIISKKYRDNRGFHTSYVSKKSMSTPLQNSQTLYTW